MKLFYTACIAILFGIINTQSANAYFTTDQLSLSADNETAIFAIDFSFGHEKYDVYIPISATRGTSSNSRISYEILGSDRVSEGSSLGVVLSEAKRVGEYYIVPKGHKMSFTFLTFFTAENIVADKYKAQVTGLPFMFDGKQQLGLNPSELQYYVTDSVDLKKK